MPQLHMCNGSNETRWEDEGSGCRQSYPEEKTVIYFYVEKKHDMLDEDYSWTVFAAFRI